LFRSASMGLHGHADRHLYLRLITTLEMIEHRSVYDISAISRQYFDGRVLQLLRDNCAAGKGTWTNNNCESMNHVLKQTVQWRRNQLPDLIDKLRSLVTGQQADADRALCGRGDYSLRPEWTKHRPVIFQCYTCMRRLQF